VAALEQQVSDLKAEAQEAASLKEQLEQQLEAAQNDGSKGKK
jgi:hemerythrin-like domain-containing protein